VQGRFKDYINSPKFNLYQSLHTTVIGPRGKSVEVQIRTLRDAPARRVRRRRALGLQGGRLNKEVAWMQRLADVEEEENDPIAFLEALKLDLGQDEVYVFTPKGRVISLVEGATTDRLRLRRAHRGRSPLRGRQGERSLVPLDTVLRSADVVEIVTSKSDTAGPSRDWLRSPSRRAPSPRSASGSSANAATTPSRAAARS
jgi:guanosine-3',5'-bis(diphosphate) 3'-pyrophosphohydrolase